MSMHERMSMRSGSINKTMAMCGSARHAVPRHDATACQASDSSIKRRRIRLRTLLFLTCLAAVALPLVDPPSSPSDAASAAGRELSSAAHSAGDVVDEDASSLVPKVAAALGLGRPRPTDVGSHSERHGEDADDAAGHGPLEGAPRSEPRPSGDVATYPDGTAVSPSPPPAEVAPYDAAAALRINQLFKHALMLVIFDSPTGTLRTYAFGAHHFNKGRGHEPAYLLSKALMRHFPARFRAGQAPFQLLFTSADLPPSGWWQYCLAGKLGESFCRRRAEGAAPIVTFGSAPKDASVLPSLRQFPLVTFLSCLEERRCGMTTAIEGTREWSDLKPQVIWRGSDFPMLTPMGFGNWRPGPSDERPAAGDATADMEELLQNYSELTPRWKAVALSIKASMDASREGSDAIPWIDAKFFSDPRVTSRDTFQQFLERFEGFKDLMKAKTRLSEKATAEYKYHLDLGGGGGTTWTGTLRKLAMPGLLFHHETPTQDFFYGDLRPWVHYVPVKTDLSDLKEKYDWAEAHPEEAQKIAQASTNFVADMATDEWINRIYKRYFVEDLGRIVEAYRPTEGEDTASVLKEYRRSMGDSSAQLYLTCTSEACTYSASFTHGVKRFSNDARKFT